MILADLDNPPTRRVARVLGLSERSIYRYTATDDAPRVALLALFWLTRWGRAAIDAQATNDAIWTN
jgi:predicted DNA-binding transcriptional regulator AlpA